MIDTPGIWCSGLSEAFEAAEQLQKLPLAHSEGIFTREQLCTLDVSYHTDDRHANVRW